MDSIYQIDSRGIFTGQVAEIEPTDPLPTDYVRATEPPALGEGEIAVHVNGGWVVSLAANMVEPPATGPSSSDINAERDRRVAAGTTVNVTGYGDIPLQGGERDQTNLLGLVTAAQVRLAGGDSSTLTKFRDADNVDHMLTPMQVIEMWSKGAAWISANYDASWTIKALDPIPADFADDSYWP